MLFGEFTCLSAEPKKRLLRIGFLAFAKTLLFCCRLALGDNFNRNPILTTEKSEQKLTI